MQGYDVHERYRSYDEQDKVVYMSLDDAVGLSGTLAREAEAQVGRVDLVVGLANGALLTARIVSDELGVPLQIIRVRRKSSRLKQRLLFVKKLLRLPPAMLRWKPLNELNKAFNRRNNEIEQERYDFDVAGKRVLLVDDCMDSGRSAKTVRERLLVSGASDVRIAVIAWGKKEWAILPDQVPPDVYLHRLIHFYPWANNSPHYQCFTMWLQSKNMALWK